MWEVQTSTISPDCLFWYFQSFSYSKQGNYVITSLKISSSLCLPFAVSIFRISWRWRQWTLLKCWCIHTDPCTVLRKKSQISTSPLLWEPVVFELEILSHCPSVSFCYTVTAVRKQTKQNLIDTMQLQLQLQPECKRTVTACQQNVYMSVCTE